MDNILHTFATIGVTILGVAIIAVLVSQQAQTSNVISSIGQAFSQVLGTAMSPVGGSSSGGSSALGNVGRVQ